VRIELSFQEEQPWIETIEGLSCRLKTRAEGAEDLEEIKKRLRDYSTQLSQTAEALREVLLVTPQEKHYL
jgi:hypothetical protein